MITIAIPAADIDARQAVAMLDGYRKYVDATPTPRIGLSVGGHGKNNNKDVVDHVAAAIRAGGIVTMAAAAGGGPARAASGVRKSAGGSNKNSPAAMAFQSLSINLPRLAYESNRDETYFRAKLALMIKPALAAMAARKKSVADGARRGLLPAFASATQSMQHASSAVMVNLTGARESVYGILGHEEAGNGAEILQKVLKTAVEVAAAEGKKLGEESAAIAMVADDGAARFATLDSEKYGKVSLLQSQNTPSYSQGFSMAGKDLLSNAALAKECAAIDKALNGGFAAVADVTDLSAAEVASVIEASSGLAFLRPQARLAVCAACGKKYKASLEKCDGCKSPHRL
jgi:ribonucleoside-triphosphate reductase